MKLPFIHIRLLEQLKKSDRAAFEHIYKEYSQKVYRFAQRYMNNNCDVEEIVQDTFVHLWEARMNIDPALNFDNYLFTITRNLIFNSHRTKVNEVCIQDTVLAGLEQEYDMLEDEIIVRDLSQYINHIIEQLPPKQQEVFNLSRQQLLPYKEIAKQLNISEKTVEAHIYQAIKYIRKNMEHEEKNYYVRLRDKAVSCVY